MSDKQELEWVAVSTQFDEYIALMHQDHLKSEGIDSVIMNKKDSSYGLNLGKGSYVYVMVREDQKQKAEEILANANLSLSEDSIPMASSEGVDSSLEVDQEVKPEEPENDSDLA